MGCRVMYGICRPHQLGICQIVSSRIVIAVVVGEIAGCDLQANAMARLETTGRWTELDAQRHHRPQFQQIFTIETVAVTRAHQAVAHLQRGRLVPICGRVLIHQTRTKKSVSGADELTKRTASG